MLTCLIHLLQYCFQGQFVHICNEIALKASFTMLSNNTCCIKMKYHFLYHCFLDNEPVKLLHVASSVSVGGKGWADYLIFTEETTQ